MADLPLIDYELLNDRQLADFLRKGCPHAFAELDRRFGKRLLSVPDEFGIGDHDAEEIIQETLLHIFRQGTALRIDSSLFGLLKSTTRQKSIQHHRRQTAQKRGGGNVIRLTAPDAIPERRPAKDEQLGSDEELEAALGKLSDDERKAINLVYFEELSHEAAAQSLGISINTLRSRFYRGRDKLHQLLNDRRNASGRDAS